MNVAGAGCVCLMRQSCVSVASILDTSFRIMEHIQRLLLFSKRLGRGGGIPKCSFIFPSRQA